MIRIVRPPEPKYLQSPKLAEARQQLAVRFADPKRQGRLRFDASLLRPIKEALYAFASGKCAYCETPLTSASSMNTEAFRPKDGARDFSNNYFPDHYWWLAYTWTNLLPACPHCNHNKRDWFPIDGKRCEIGATDEALANEKALLLDPCADDPCLHLRFDADGRVTGLTNRGRVTIEILGLNRPYLIERRKMAWTETTQHLAVFLGKQKEPATLRQTQLDYLHTTTAEVSELTYVATRRAAVQAWTLQHPQAWDQLVNNTPTLDATDLPAVATVESIPKEPKKEVQKVEKQLATLKRFSIKRIEIQNFKGMASLVLDVMPPYEKEFHESWLLLLGDNGVGKSSILQAIALALTGAGQAEAMGLRPIDILQRGKRRGYVKIFSHEQPDPIMLTFDRHTISGGATEPLTFLLAYGSTRLLPKGDIKPEKNPKRYTKINNLFDYSVALNPVDSWLSSLKGDQFNQRIAPALFDLLALKEGDRLYLNKGKLVIEQFNGELGFTLEDISDGYKNIIALASDITQALSVDQASYHATQGVVLIDELGNHLHPRWRMRIVDSLRRAFPNLQFIVTTHEPLCLRGLAHGEVTVLVRDKRYEVRALDHTMLPDHTLLRVDQLLTSDLFGLIDTMDPRLEKTYEDYYALLAKTDRTPQEDEAVAEYQQQLAGKQVLGSTPQEQVYYQVIEEEFAQSLREDGFKTTEQLKVDTIKKVKSKIKSTLDWL